MEGDGVIFIICNCAAFLLQITWFDSTKYELISLCYNALNDLDASLQDFLYSPPNLSSENWLFVITNTAIKKIT